MKWQGDPAAGPAKIPDGHILYRFKVGGPTDEDLARQAVNELLVGEEVTDAIKDFQAAEQAAPPGPPAIVEHPIDDQLQTGDSRLLGGAMEIKAPWRRD